MEYYLALKKNEGNSLVVQWLGLHAFTAKGRGSIPVLGTKILQATLCSQKFLFLEKKNNNVKKKKKEWNLAICYNMDGSENHYTK